MNGYPLFAQGLIGTLYLPNLVLYRFLPFVLANNASLVLSIMFLGTGTYLFLRRLSLHPLSSLFGALTFAFSGTVITQLTHPQVILTMGLMPWVFLSGDILLSSWSFDSFLFFIFVSLEQYFAGFPQSVFITHFFFLFYSFIFRRTISYRSLFIRLAGVYVCIFVLSLPQLLPSIEYSKQLTVSKGFLGDFATQFSYPLKHLITLVSPFALGNPSIGTYPSFTAFDGSIFWENTAYIGILPLLCLGLLMTKNVRQKNLWSAETHRVFGFLSLVTFSFLLMTGKYSPLYILYSFPPFTLFRTPSRFIWTFVFFLTILASLGIDKLRSFLFRTIFIAALVCLIGIQSVILIHTFSSYHAKDDAHIWFSRPEILRTIEITRARILSVGNEALHNSIFLKNGWHDMGTLRAQRNTLSQDQGSLIGLDSMNDFVGRSMKRSSVIHILLQKSLPTSESATVSPLFQNILTMYGTTMLASPFELYSKSLTKINETTISGQSYVLYQNTLVSSSLSTPKTILFAKTTGNIETMLSDPSLSARDTAILEGNERIVPISHLVVISNIQEKESEIHATVRSDLGSLLVYDALYYPGWEAKIDHKNVPIIPVNVIKQGIIVPAGIHKIEFRYVPKLFYLGLLISGLALIIITIAILFRFFVFPPRIAGGTRKPSSHPFRNHGTQ